MTATSWLSHSQTWASDGSEDGSVGANGQRGGARAAGGAEGHEAAQEGRGASQVSSDLCALKVCCGFMVHYVLSTLTTQCKLRDTETIRPYLAVGFWDDKLTMMCLQLVSVASNWQKYMYSGLELISHQLHCVFLLCCCEQVVHSEILELFHRQWDFYWEQ